MVSKLIKFLYSFYVGSNNCLFFFKNSDISINFGVTKLIILKVSQCCRDLVFTFMVKKYKKSSCIIINLKLSPHRLFNSPNKTASENNVIYRVAFKLTDVIWSWLCIHYHTNSDRCKNFWFPNFLLLLLLSSLTTKSWAITTLVIKLLGIKETTWSTIRKHF